MVVNEKKTLNPAQKKKIQSYTFLIVGILLTVICGWILFVTLKVIQHPKLILYFPEPYSFLIGGFLGGIISTIIGFVKIKSTKL